MTTDIFAGIPNCWVEKTIVKNRSDRTSGAHALGEALWSPKLAGRDRDLYANMRKVAVGDIIFHFVDNEVLRGVSVVAGAADGDFVGLAGTEWAGKPCYRVALRDYREIRPPIHRRDFLASTEFRARIDELLVGRHGMFFNREYKLNQGSYLTVAPVGLLQIWNEIHHRETGTPLDVGFEIPPYTGTVNPKSPGEQMPFNSGIVQALSDALDRSNLHISRQTMVRVLSSLACKRFLIVTGLAGSGKSRVIQALARWFDEGQGASYLMLPVGADWTTNENIVGYADGLDAENYVSKPALELIFRAFTNRDTPHFLILDEMNLSHVERYFSDMLSALESSEPIPLYEGARRVVNGSEVPQRLQIPENLFVVGTVNVDETTYMFSPKVLDRANVIEFRMDVHEFSSFLDDPSKPDLSELDGEGKLFGKAFVDAAKGSVPEFSDALKAAYAAEMLLFFKALSAHGAEFGYRTAYEAARLVHYIGLLSVEKASDSNANDESGLWRDWFTHAIDCVVLQKILPKLHGSRVRLGPLLKKLWLLCVNEFADRGDAALRAVEEAMRSTDKRDEPSAEIPARAPYPLSAEKIGRMWRLLNENGFASFAEA
jgi:hypothetical protein